MNDNINIPDSNITTELTFRKLVLMNMQQLTNFPYIEKDFDALTDYELLCLVVKFLNDVIDNQNEQNDSITRMYESFLALQDYVNNTKDTLEDAFNELDDYVRTFFANLDVQDEIDNKIDEMVQDGTLLEVFNSYMVNYVNVKNMGAVGDGLTDDTNAIKSAIALNQPLYFPEGTYLLSESITLTNDVNWVGQGRKTIINSIPISDTNESLIQPLFNFSNLNNVRLKGFSTNNSTFKIMPTIQSGENIKEVLKNRNIIVEDVTIDTNDINISEKTNWEGMFINTPAPDNYTRDFHDGKYSRYGIQIFNNSGYNAIDIDNRIYDGEGNFATIQDNSALGIVDGVLSSAPAFFMDMHGERNAINIKNRTETSSASSTSNPDSVFQVGYQGHLAIGCSVYDETGATGVGTVKLKDSSPSIRFYDTNYPNNICMIREQNNQFQFLANGTLCSHYDNNLYHVYNKPLKVGDLVSTGGGLILGSTAYSGSDYHVFVDSNGVLKINRTTAGTPQTAEAGYSVQVNKSGASSSRPTGLSNDWQSIGTMFFDTTLGKPIFWNGTGWVDATGTSV